MVGYWVVLSGLGIIGLVDRDKVPTNLHREAFGLRVGVVGEIAEEGAAGAWVVLLGGEEGAERAVHLGDIFPSVVGWLGIVGAEAGEETVGFHGACLLSSVLSCSSF